MIKLLTTKKIHRGRDVKLLKIKIITVGKLKEKYLVQGINEYLKRLQSYAKVEIIEVADEKAPENLSEAEMLQVKNKEGERILAKISDQDHVFVLAINGKQFSSEEFSKEIEQLGINGKSQLAFVIGGSLGLSDEVMKRSQKQMSFGKLTYPHQLMRLVLVEQIYRGFRIMRGEPYHK
jgi:23S rRNA (pseudouridine1915-N3)-methyltransferase